jgi:hypothetical protein
MMKVLIVRLAVVALTFFLGISLSASVGKFKANERDSSVYSSSQANLPLVCPVHHTIMSLERVPVLHGEASYDPEESKARKELFPYANNAFYTCAVGEEGFLYDYVCQECRVAESDWLFQHRMHSQVRIR